MSAFEVIPAIDLLDGRCVRLLQGRYDEATVYPDDPDEVAARFAAEAIARLHVVDLDGARAGAPANRKVVERIVARMGSVPVQLGGGIRSLAAVEDALACGIDRVVLGTVALREPELVRSAARRFPARIAVGLDARDGAVAVEGWLETSEASALELARRFEDAGVAAIIYTDITRDGTLQGPNVPATAALAETISIPVIASGGVGTLAHVRAVAEAARRGVAGVIIGRALHGGAFDLRSALEAAACS